MVKLMIGTKQILNDLRELAEEIDPIAEDMRPLLEGESYTEMYLVKRVQQMKKADATVKTAKERLSKAESKQVAVYREALDPRVLIRAIASKLGKDFKVKPKDMKAAHPAVRVLYVKNNDRRNYLDIGIVLFNEKLGVAMSDQIKVLSDAGFEDVNQRDSDHVQGEGLFLTYRMRYYY